MGKVPAQRQKERRERQKANGLCVGCDNPPEPDKTRCQRCLDNNAKSNRESYQRRKKAGLCIRYGCSDPPFKDHVECQTHYDETARRSARINQQLEAERAAANLCTKCGERPPRPQFAMCYVCQAVARAEWNKRQEIKRYEAENGRERAD